jgi:hypothetical protein
MKDVTLPQVLLCLGLLAALLLAGKFLPEHFSHVAQSVLLVFAFFKDPNKGVLGE